MTSHEKQFPTQGDLCREQLRRRGVAYHGDVQSDVARRLAGLSPATRAAFAVACAERVMRWHERLPPREQRPFTLAWRPVLDAIWQGLERRDEQCDRRVRDALAEFHASPYGSDDEDDPDPPLDANDDAAAASIEAAECFVSGSAQSASWAAGRAVDLAFLIADEELQLNPNDFVWDPAAEPMPFAKEAMHPAVQQELRRQLADLELLQREGVTAAVLGKLKTPAAA